MKILSITGRLIYDSNSEITIKECLLEAFKDCADLRGANLRGANLCVANLCGTNLRDADLRGANLYGTDLRGANFNGANLRDANFNGADLRGANLRDADLRDADLRGANLYGADLYGAKNKELACIPMYCKWSLSIIDNKIKVGCKEKTVSEWIKWLKSDEEYITKRGTDEFKQIEACIKAYITYQKVIKSK